MKLLVDLFCMAARIACKNERGGSIQTSTESSHCDYRSYDNYFARGSSGISWAC